MSSQHAAVASALSQSASENYENYRKIILLVTSDQDDSAREKRKKKDSLGDSRRNRVFRRLPVNRRDMRHSASSRELY
jgi:hypothetical protein